MIHLFSEIGEALRNFWSHSLQNMFNPRNNFLRSSLNFSGALFNLFFLSYASSRYDSHQRGASSNCKICISDPAPEYASPCSSGFGLAGAFSNIVPPADPPTRRLNFFKVLLLRDDLLSLRDDLLSLRDDLLSLRTDLLTLRDDLLTLRVERLTLRDDLLSLRTDLLTFLKLLRVDLLRVRLFLRVIILIY